MAKYHNISHGGHTAEISYKSPINLNNGNSNEFHEEQSPLVTASNLKTNSNRGDIIKLGAHKYSVESVGTSFSWNKQ